MNEAVEVALSRISLKFNLKAIHNNKGEGGYFNFLVTNIVEIQFESNSQLLPHASRKLRLVTNIVEIQFESNSQRPPTAPIFSSSCHEYR